MAGIEYNGGGGDDDAHPPPNPLDPAAPLKEPSNSNLLDKTVHPQQSPTAEDSAVTRAEKIERHGILRNGEESPAKRRKVDAENGSQGPIQSERRKGVAPIKKESVPTATPT